jgi:hypothetical protein
MKKASLLILTVIIPAFLIAQPGSEIYLGQLTLTKNQVSISRLKNITNHPGYDNQPFFHPAKPLLYYVSFNDSTQSDIKVYNYQTNLTKNITNTPDNEFSPTVTPDGKYLSCIIQRPNGAQDLGKYPINGGEASVMVSYLTVGYHAWVDERSLLLFVLDDTAHNSLHYYNLLTTEDAIVAYNPGRSIHKIPGENAMSFIEKKNENEWWIQRYDIATRAITPIIQTLPKKEDMVWLNNGTILMSDGDKLFYFDTRTGKEWLPVKVPADFMLKGITRLAVNKLNNRIAIVAAE